MYRLHPIAKIESGTTVGRMTRMTSHRLFTLADLDRSFPPVCAISRENPHHLTSSDSFLVEITRKTCSYHPMLLMIIDSKFCLYVNCPNSVEESMKSLET